MDEAAENSEQFAVAVATGGVQVVMCLTAPSFEALRDRLRDQICGVTKKGTALPVAQRVIEGAADPDDSERSMVMVIPGAGTVVSFMGSWADYKKRQAAAAAARQKQVQGIPRILVPQGAIRQ